MGLYGSLGHGVAEDHDRTQEFVLPLLGPLQQQFELAPLFGGLNPLSTPPDHVSPRSKTTPFILPPQRSPSPSERRDDTFEG